MNICLVCEKEFVKKSSTSGKYCSLPCWYKAYDKQNEKICIICKNKFSGSTGQKTCSRLCADKSRRTAKRNTNCAFCGKDLAVNCHPRVRFCSKRCGLMERDRKGELSRPEGSKHLHSTGYVQIKIGGKWVMEHRHVMEQKLGRSLLPNERVHHKNGIRNANEEDNLELWVITKDSKKDPAGQRISDLIGYVIEFHKEELLRRLKEVKLNGKSNYKS